MSADSLRWKTARRVVTRHGTPPVLEPWLLQAALDRAETALRTAEERLQLIARATNDTIWDWNLRDNSVWHNQGLRTAFGHTEPSAGSTADWWLARIHPHDRDQVVHAIQVAMARGDETWHQEYRFERQDGSYAHVLARGVVQYDGALPVRMVGVLLDVSERKRIEHELTYRATHDALTGLANRALITRTLGQALETAYTSGHSLALLLADLDRFKRINDTFGHPTGDAVLRVVAERWRSALRSRDLLGRLGGDEFAVILPRASERTAEIIARRLVDSLHQPISLDGQRLHVGASWGLAVYPTDGSEPDALLQRADQAMYASKRRGGGFRTLRVS